MDVASLSWTSKIPTRLTVTMLPWCTMCLCAWLAASSLSRKWRTSNSCGKLRAHPKVLPRWEGLCTPLWTNRAAFSPCHSKTRFTISTTQPRRCRRPPWTPAWRTWAPPAPGAEATAKTSNWAGPATAAWRISPNAARRARTSPAATRSPTSTSPSRCPARTAAAKRRSARWTRAGWAPGPKRRSRCRTARPCGARAACLQCRGPWWPSPCRMGAGPGSSPRPPERALSQRWGRSRGNKRSR